MKPRRLFDRLRNRTAAFAHDLLMVPIAWLGAFWLRFNLDTVPEPYLGRALEALPFVVVIQASVFWYFGLYRGVWRFASIPDLVRILRAVVVGMSLAALAVFMSTRMAAIPRSVFPLAALLLVVALGGPRLIYRWFKDRHLYRDGERRVLIVGAGKAGEMLARDLLRERGHGYFPVGFVDDDREKKGSEIHGVRVLDYTKRLAQVAQEHDVDVILLAIPSATTAEMRRILRECERTGLPMRTLPRLGDLVSGRATVSALREIRIEDLLGREPVHLDWDRIHGGLSGKRVLVTGGGGSIGSELCRQLVRLAPARLIVLDNAEFSLYRIERELRAAAPDAHVAVALADIRDETAVERVFAEHRPDMVFHAAAYKHVPLLEGRAREAAQNNVLGTANVARAAARHGSGGFVLISTDKAVNPTNVMGASKRAAEMSCQALASAGGTTRFITVRFGNVLDSAGSVVPLFREQIAEGGPVTVTHPDVTRYFMTIPEACQLILEAGAVGKGGEIFVLEMGEAIPIRYLAEQMIRLAGHVPDEDIEVRFIGLRPGEKLTEELFYPHEERVATGHDKLLQARYRERDWDTVTRVLTALESACGRYEEAECERLLASLVPELARTESSGANVLPFEKVAK